MGKKLDLTLLQRDVFELVLLDGSTIHIKKPTQEMVIKITEMQDIEDYEPVEQMKMAYDLMLTILNHNTDKRVFTLGEIQADYDIEILQAIFVAYSDFAQEIVNKNPN